MNALTSPAGISPRASLPAACPPNPGRRERSCEIEPTICLDGWQQGFRGPRYEAFWLHTSGDGHWCSGGRRAGRFLTRANAELHGRFWVETGHDVATTDGKRLFEEWRAVEFARDQLNNRRRHGLDRVSIGRKG